MTEDLEKKCSWKFQVERRLLTVENPKEYQFENKTLNECKKCTGYNYKCEGYMKRAK